MPVRVDLTASEYVRLAEYIDAHVDNMVKQNKRKVSSSWANSLRLKECTFPRIYLNTRLCLCFYMRESSCQLKYVRVYLILAKDGTKYFALIFPINLFMYKFNYRFLRSVQWTYRWGDDLKHRRNK